MKQIFQLEYQGRKEMVVLAQMSYKYDAMSIQISKVKDPDDNEVKFVYEEIDENDFVKYAIFEMPENIRRNYPWAVTILPLVPLTKKQEQVLKCVKNGDFSGEDVIGVEEFKAVAEEVLGITPKAIEGILSSLWVKGYIRMSILAGPGLRYFTLEPFGVEFLKNAEPAEQVEKEEADEDEGEE